METYLEKLSNTEKCFNFSPVDLQSKNLSDIVIQCEDGTFNGLQSVLAMASTFLKELLVQSQILNNDFNSHVNPLLVLSIPDVSVRQISLVFTLFLTGKVEDLTMEDVILLKRVWKLLKIDRFNIQSLEVLMNDEKEGFKAHKDNSKGNEKREDFKANNNEDLNIETQHNNDAEKYNKFPKILLPNKSVEQLMQKQADIKEEYDYIKFENNIKNKSNQNKELTSLWEAYSEETPTFESESVDCQFCDEGFNKVGLLITHLKTHLLDLENNQVHLKCTVKDCDYKLTIVSNPNTASEKRVTKMTQLVTIEDHFRAKHTKEPKQHCPECQRKFFSNQALTYHVKQHKISSKFYCHGCDHFVKRSKFDKHTKNDCLNTINRFSCETCGKHFNDKKHLEVHTKTHTKEKPYKCDHCKKRFLQKGNCKSHMVRKHTFNKNI